ncbi:ATP-binding cassette domain-containing protein [Nocardioides convexus]|uniref:ATP-binding cassette domain-containing protein n=1 Tax=Nocardioides convexus TaxID=2712224 RepID=UPI0024187949|nr:ATP-binding cassette domain-containing protein [Nocardioides convexus]
MSAALAARGITLSYGHRPVLDAVDLDVRRREVLALVGPNGAGKSTLLAVLAGDVTPDDGVVESGRPAARAVAAARDGARAGGAHPGAPDLLPVPCRGRGPDGPRALARAARGGRGRPRGGRGDGHDRRRAARRPAVQPALGRGEGTHLLRPHARAAHRHPAARRAHRGARHRPPGRPSWPGPARRRCPARPWSSCCTTCPWPRPGQTGSRCCTAAGSPPRARPPRCSPRPCSASSTTTRSTCSPIRPPASLLVLPDRRTSLSREETA